jgi:hypothetical protein
VLAAVSTSTASRAAMRHGAGRGAGARKRLHAGGDPLGDSQHRRVEPDSARFSIGKPRGRWWAAWMAGAAQRRTVRPDIAPICCRRVPPATFDIEYFGWVPNPGADRLRTALPAPGPVRVPTRTTPRRSARRRSMLHPGSDRTACRARHAVGQHPPTRADPAARHCLAGRLRVGEAAASRQALYGGREAFFSKKTDGRVR